MQNTKNLHNIILVILTLLSFWAIASVQLHSLPLVGVNFCKETAQSVNKVLLTLSYSYVAALVFYILTNVLPAKQRKNKLQPIIKQKVLQIGRNIHDIMLEFSRGTSFNHDLHNTSNTEALLKSKDWFSVNPMLLHFNKVKITYLNHMRVCGDNMTLQISDLIIKYHEEMTASQLVELENLSESNFFHTVSFICSAPESRIAESGYASLISDFVDLQNQYMKVEKEFKISHS